MAKVKAEIEIAKEQDEAYKGCYGSKLKPSELVEYLEQCFLMNMEHEKAGRDKFPVCIWGHAGIGKTGICEQFREREVLWNGVQTKWNVVIVPLAQFEEMGDLHGMPDSFVCARNEYQGIEQWIPKNESVIQQYVKAGYIVDLAQGVKTMYCRPDWVPDKDGPTIIVFDDGNRASQRILKGTMQLMQKFQMMSWKLPKGCQIVMTANPDGQDYIVTTMDEAQITRMKHFVLVPDSKEWSVWADKHGIDGRLINYVLMYPEMMLGSERTNPRTLSEFGYALKRLPDLTSVEAQKALVVHGKSLLDEDTVISFNTFVSKDVEITNLDPEKILDGDKAMFGFIKCLVAAQEQRLDIVGVVVERLYGVIAKAGFEATAERVANFQKFVLLPNLPEDISNGLCRRVGLIPKKDAIEWVSGNSKLKKLIMDMVK